MTVHPIQGSEGLDQPEQQPNPPTPHAANTSAEPPKAASLPTRPEPAPKSALDLFNRTVCDTERTTNTVAVIKAASNGIAKIILSAGLVLAVLVILTTTLIHFAGFGPAVGSAVAVGVTSLVAGGRYLRNKRASKKKLNAQPT